jgi:hypothetical protein
MIDAQDFGFCFWPVLAAIRGRGRYLGMPRNRRIAGLNLNKRGTKSRRLFLLSAVPACRRQEVMFGPAATDIRRRAGGDAPVLRHARDACAGRRRINNRRGGSPTRPTASPLARRSSGGAALGRVGDPPLPAGVVFERGRRKPTNADKCRHRRGKKPTNAAAGRAKRLQKPTNVDKRRHCDLRDRRRSDLGRTMWTNVDLCGHMWTRTPAPPGARHRQPALRQGRLRPRESGPA